MFQILNWKSAAVKTQCWRKEIGQAMVLKGAEAPLRRRRKKKKKHRVGPNSFITVTSNDMLWGGGH